jgi:multidrug efflux system outer membrane protein
MKVMHAYLTKALPKTLVEARWHLVISLTFLIISGCALEQPPVQDEMVVAALPTVEVPAEWSAEELDTGLVDNGWIETFGDLKLVELVDEAMANSPDLRISAAQVDRAAALLDNADAALQPGVSLAGDVTGVDTGSRSDTASSAGVGVSWELDVWGRVRAGAAATEESLRATRADFEFARQSLAARVANAWFLNTESTLQVDLAEEITTVYKSTLDIAEKKQKVGKVTMKDVHLARANLATSEDALRQSKIAWNETVRALEVLLGRYPSAELEAAERLVAVPPQIPAGTPSDIIARRPDLISAERRVAAAFFRTEEARLASLPSFSLTGGVGTSSMASSISSLGAGVSMPLFDGGALEAQLDVVTADQEASIANYGSVLLRAFQEVETALINEKFLQQREELLATVVEENAKALELSRKEYEVGKIGLENVLLTQAYWVAARISLINIKNQRLFQRVNLHLALGGSFE